MPSVPTAPDQQEGADAHDRPFEDGDGADGAGGDSNLHQRARRAQMVIAGVAVLMGAVGTIRAADVGFASDRSVPVIEHRFVDGPLVTLNQAGALALVVLGLAGLVFAWFAMRRGLWLVAGGFALVGILTAAQYGREVNLLGGNGSMLSFALMEGVGLLALSFVTRPS
ncbi:MAG: hypothetical protein ACT4OS_05150 [Acidimicrobiales bacterium]